MSESQSSGVGERVTRWFYISGNRLWVAALLCVMLVGLTALLIALDIVYVGPGSNLSTALSSGLLSGLLTLLTVTLSINQLILSRLFGSAGALSGQLEGTLEFRRTVEEIADVHSSPNEPGAFLALLGETTRRRVEVFRREVEPAVVDFDEGDDPGAYAASVADFADRIATADDIDDPLEVLLLTLGEDYAQHLKETQEHRSRYGDRLSDSAAEALDDVFELLKSVATMRQFYKTLTLQQELAQLSRQLMYTGVPAIAATYFLSFVYTGSPSLPTAIDPTYMPVVVSVATGVIFAPLAVLIAALLRVATVSLYSVSVGSFVPPESTFGSE